MLLYPLTLDLTATRIPSSIGFWEIRYCSELAKGWDDEGLRKLQLK